MSVSVGAAEFPIDGVDAETLLARADRSMYKMKQSRRARSGRTSVREEAFERQPAVYTVQ